MARTSLTVARTFIVHFKGCRRVNFELDRTQDYLEVFTTYMLSLRLVKSLTSLNLVFL